MIYILFSSAKDKNVSMTSDVYRPQSLNIATMVQGMIIAVLMEHS